MRKQTLSEEARQARNAYKREWARKHPDKVKEANAKYWENLAKKQAESEATTCQKKKEKEEG